MRLVVDLQACQTASRERGIGRYSLALTRALARRMGNHEIWLTLNAAFPESVEWLRQAFDDAIPRHRIAVFSTPLPVAENEAANEWRSRTAEPIREAFLSTLAPDIVLLASLFEGLVDDATTSIGMHDGDIVNAVTLYDLIPMLRPDVLTKPTAKRWYDRKLESLRRADLLLAISEHARAEAMAALNVPAERIAVISTAASDCFRPRAIGDAERAALYSQYGDGRPFVLYSGGFEERKNVRNLILAFARLPQSLRDAYQLILVGRLDAHERKGLLSYCARCGLRERDVVLPGFLTDDELVAFYNLCELFVFPSFHEGFGLPALEAMACGAAVIGSNATSVPEVIGRADALFDPASVDEIGALLHLALTDASFRVELKAHAVRQAARFSWDTTARRALDAMVANAERRAAASQDSKPLVAAERPRPRLAYVSPLPPERTGIASYSAELLPSLMQHYDIELVVDQPAVDLRGDLASLPVRSIAWFEENAERCDRVLYQLGNSPFHQHMFGLLERHPGTVVLHDFYLGGVLNWMDLGITPGIYRQSLFESHGYPGLIADAVLDRETMIDRFPCNLRVLEWANGIIVHSESARKLASTWYGDAGEEWCRVAQMHVLPDLGGRAVARRALELAPDDILICSLGFLDPAKLSRRLLDAWLVSSLSHDSRCHLAFVGSNHGGEYGHAILGAIAAAPAPERIRVTGFVDPNAFERYLLGADIAVQLRGVTRGETSRAVLDCLAFGIPLIANASGALAELPDSALFRLPAEFSDTELSRAMEKLATDIELRAGLARAGREHVGREHDPVRVAAELRNAIERFALNGSQHRYRRLIHSICSVASSVAPQPADWVATAESVGRNLPSRGLPQLLVDVSVLVRQDLKTGIERVARSVLKRLLDDPPAGYRVEPVFARDGQYWYARRFTCEWRGLAPVGIDDEPIDVRSGDRFLGLDWAADIIPHYKGVLQRYRTSGVVVVFVVYDLLPVLHPEHYPAGIDEMQSLWLRSIASTSDGLVCISRSVADELVNWLNAAGPNRTTPLRIGFFHLGADIARSQPTDGVSAEDESVLESIAGKPAVLIVGTVEPRKGHRQALAALESMWRGGVDMSLVIVGKQGWMVDELAAALRVHPEQGKRLLWLEDASDEFLERVYAHARVLLAPSLAEGFGLPLIEAARHGLPILARDLPVFREVAGEHAFYFSGEAAADLAKALTDWLALDREARVPDSRGIRWKACTRASTNCSVLSCTTAGIGAGRPAPHIRMLETRLSHATSIFRVTPCPVRCTELQVFRGGKTGDAGRTRM